MQNWVALLGRLLLGLALFGSGILTITRWDVMLKEISSSPLQQVISKQLMPTILVAKFLVETLGGACIAAGFRFKAAISVVAVFLAVKLLFFHDPMIASQKIATSAYNAFLSDAKILGALLLAFLVGPGKYSIDKG